MSAEVPFVDGARQVPCSACGHVITEYETGIGLLPTEARPDGSWSNHSKLVCELRQELTQRVAEVAELRAEALRALKIGYERTQDCQTVPEMATALVEAIGHLSKEADKQLSRACAAEKERDALQVVLRELRGVLAKVPEPEPVEWIVQIGDSSWLAEPLPTRDGERLVRTGHRPHAKGFV